MTKTKHRGILDITVLVAPLKAGGHVGTSVGR